MNNSGSSRFTTPPPVGPKNKLQHAEFRSIGLALVKWLKRNVGVRLRATVGRLLLGPQLGPRYVSRKLREGDARRKTLRVVAETIGAQLDYRTAKEIAAASPSTARYSELSPSLSVIEARPLGLADWAWEVFQGDRLEKVGPNFVLSVSPGTIVSSSGWVVADDRVVVADLWNDPLTKAWHAADEIITHLGLGSRRLKGTAAVIMTQWADNYYHWLLQALPRLELIRRVEGQLGCVDWYVVPKLTKAFQRESIRLAGINGSKLVELSQGTITADTVIASNVPAEGSYHIGQRWIAEYLRSIIPPLPHVATFERIYVARRLSVSRRIANERAVRDLLHDLDFHSVSMDGLSLRAQASLFHSARVIVAVHGGALANLVHTRPGCALVELLPANYLQPVFKRMSDEYGLHYYPVVGVEPHLPVNHYNRLPEADLRIDLDELHAAIRMALTQAS